MDGWSNKLDPKKKERENILSDVVCKQIIADTFVYTALIYITIDDCSSVFFTVHFVKFNKVNLKIRTKR